MTVQMIGQPKERSLLVMGLVLFENIFLLTVRDIDILYVIVCGCFNHVTLLETCESTIFEIIYKAK